MRMLLPAALLAVTMSVTPGLAEPEAVTLDRKAAAELLALVNEERGRRGIPPVARDPRLEEVAIAHTLSMARDGVLRHNDRLFTRESHAELGISRFGENVAYDWSVPAAHEAFLGSAEHRDNVFGPAYRLAGFAVVRDSDGALWVTEDFGTPRMAPRPAATTPAAPRKPRPKAARPVRVAALRPLNVVPIVPLAPRVLATVRDVPEPPRPVGPVETPRPAATPPGTGAHHLAQGG